MKITLLVSTLASVALGASLAAQSGLQISSTAFPANGTIPQKYACDGERLNPPLAFSGVPAKAQSLVLIMDDPDVPKTLVPSGVFDHWLVWDLPTTSKGFAEGDKSAGTTGLNGMGKPGYVAPCPPDKEHRYFFKLYALDTKLTGAKIANKADLEAAMKGHIVGQAELIGKYNQQKNMQK